MSHQDIPDHAIPSRGFMGTAIAAVLIAILAACFVNMPDSSQQPAGTPGPSAPPTSKHPQGNMEPALRSEVPTGSNVWTVVSDHVYKYHSYMTPREHEHEVSGMVQVLQLHIRLDPRQPVRDVNIVPAGYVFYMSPSGLISLDYIPS